MYLNLFYGILKETRTVLLYSIPAALVLFLLKYYHFDLPLLMVFASSLVFVVVIAIEDRDTMDAQLKSLLARMCTAIGFYYGMKYFVQYVLTESNFGSIIRDNVWDQLIKLLREYIAFMESMSVVRIFLNGFVSCLYVIATLITRIVPV